ncbi:MFS transporter [Arthrobacter sp. MMS24-S77]
MLLLCLAAGFITLLDQSVFTLAIPAMTAALHAKPAEVQWILASYSLAFGLALVPAGRLGDLMGRRRLFLAGLAVFGACSLLAGLATDPVVVIVARLLQGFGAGTLNPQVLGFLQDMPAAFRAKAIGAYASIGGFAAVCGPLLGGLILSGGSQDVSWRLLFLFNLPFVVVALPLAAKYLGKAERRESAPLDLRSASLDVVGVVLLCAVVLTALLPTIYGYGESPWLWMSGAATAWLAFAAWEFGYGRSGKTPLLSPLLVKSGGFILGTVVALNHFGVGAAMAVLTSFYFMAGEGLAPLSVAGILAPQAVGMLLSSALSWRFVSRFGRGGVVLAVLAGLMTLLAKDQAVQQLEGFPAALAVAGIGLLQGLVTGLVVAPNQSLTLGHAPVRIAGVAAGFYQLSQRFAAALCSAAVGGLIFGLVGTRTGYRGAFHDGVVLCCSLLAVAAVAGSLDLARAKWWAGPALESNGNVPAHQGDTRVSAPRG